MSSWWQPVRVRASHMKNYPYTYRISLAILGLNHAHKVHADQGSGDPCMRRVWGEYMRGFDLPKS